MSMRYLIKLAFLILALSPLLNLNAHVDNEKDKLSLGWFNGNDRKVKSSIPKSLIGSWIPVSPKVSQTALHIWDKSITLEDWTTVLCKRDIICYYKDSSLHVVYYINDWDGFVIHYFASSDTLSIRIRNRSSSFFTTYFKRR